MYNSSDRTRAYLKSLSKSVRVKKTVLVLFILARQSEHLCARFKSDNIPKVSFSCKTTVPATLDAINSGTY